MLDQLARAPSEGKASLLERIKAHPEMQVAHTRTASPDGRTVTVVRVQTSSAGEKGGRAGTGPAQSKGVGPAAHAEPARRPEPEPGIIPLDPMTSTEGSR